MKRNNLPKNISKTIVATLGVALVQYTALAQNPPAAQQPAIRQAQGQSEGQNQGQAQKGQSQDQTIRQNQPGDESRQSSQGQSSLEVTKFIHESTKCNLMEIKMGRLAMEKAQSPAVKQYAQTLINDHTKALQQLAPLAQKKGVTLPATVHEQLTEASSLASSNGEKKTGTTLDRQPVRDTVKDQSQREQRDRTAPDLDQDRRLTRDQPRRNDQAPDDAHHGADEKMAMQKLQGLSGTEFDRAFAAQMVTDHEKAISKFEEAVRSVNDPEVKSFASAALPTLRQHLQQAQGLKTSTQGAQRE